MSSPTKHMKELCEELGKEYAIKIIDCEWVIYRDFDNGFDVEISGVDTTSPRKRATIYLWKDKTRIVKTITDIAQGNIGDRVEELKYITETNMFDNE